jgi:hypothetical protein
MFGRLAPQASAVVFRAMLLAKKLAAEFACHGRHGEVGMSLSASGMLVRKTVRLTLTHPRHDLGYKNQTDRVKTPCRNGNQQFLNPKAVASNIFLHHGPAC